jgi:hypothetical protein
MLAGVLIVGPVVSLTVTVNDFGAAGFPAASVALHVTVVVVKPNVVPDAGLHEAGFGGSTLSVAVAANPTGAPPEPVASAMMSSGTAIVGGVVSTRFTVTEKPAEPVFPEESVAVHVTSVVPTSKCESEDGVQLGVGDPETASVAVAAS